jgi:hypothetical protein
MDLAPISSWLGIIGGVLAIPLFILRVFEFRRDRRPSLSVTTILRSHVEEGNDVTLLNSSKMPASIYSLDLVWAKRGWLGKNSSLGRRVIRTEYHLEDSRANITVPANGAHNLNFSEDSHFTWGRSIEHDLYLRLWMVGQKGAVWLWITGPSKEAQELSLLQRHLRRRRLHRTAEE